ncbi:hypothetical protein GP486_007222 [Trichoglossum hirsutum]|uniref:Uncharacterized protein n=1 Tax=Trichoglossum hirsutum TaxID=265104 RepID=A0A9P8L7N2_9PEZI|nr:hypothetical protein GP486_007222 [Trichoglossum hirsutum]
MSSTTTSTSPAGTVPPSAPGDSGTLSSVIIALATSSSGTIAQGPPSSGTIAQGPPSSGTPAPGNSTHTGLAAGAVAGIAVGAGVACLLIGAVATYFFLSLYVQDISRSRERKESQQPPSIPVEEHLPQPAEDRKVEFDVGTLSTLIEQHVENFYHRDPVNAADIKSLEAEFPRGLGRQRVKGELVADKETRWVALRQYIAAVLVAGMSPYGDTERTFLPREVVTFLRSVTPPKERDSGKSLLSLLLTILKLTFRPPRKAFSDIYNAWRAFSAYLLRPSSSTEAAETSIANILNVLNRVLHPFAIRESEPERAKSLKDILKRAAKLGLLLFEQRENWEFRWPEMEHGERVQAVAVFPALIKGGGMVVRGAEVERV